MLLHTEQPPPDMYLTRVDFGVTCHGLIPCKPDGGGDKQDGILNGSHTNGGGEEMERKLKKKKKKKINSTDRNLKIFVITDPAPIRAAAYWS